MNQVRRMVGSSGPMLRVEAPAKVNLFLEVLGRRADGFHDIETVFSAISLTDTLEVRQADDDRLRVDCRWAPGLAAAAARHPAGLAALLGQLPDERDDLVYRALDRLRREAGVDRGLEVRVTKRIPAAAGLGGASSDAAAALVAADRLWQLGYGRERLARLGAELGSDIPFFLRAPGGWAIGRGRGERIEAIRVPVRLALVVVRPPAGLRTADVYARCQPGRPARAASQLVEAFCAGQAAAGARQMVNRLEGAAESLTPWVGRLREQFRRFDCLGHQMTGSGTSYVAVCHHGQQARRLAAAVRADGRCWAWAVTTCRVASRPGAADRNGAGEFRAGQAKEYDHGDYRGSRQADGRFG